jgi:hypothetical protein
VFTFGDCTRLRDAALHRLASGLIRLRSGSQLDNRRVLQPALSVRRPRIRGSISCMKSCVLSILLILFASRCYASDVEINTKKVPSGTAKTYYSALITAKGGCTPYKWGVVSGKLPPGLKERESGNTTSLDLSGTPTVAASYSFTVSVTGCGGHVSKASYKIVVKAAASHVVDLRWDASPSKDVAGYNLYRGPDGLRWKKINDSLVASTYFDDSTVTDGSTYYYSATAVSVSGEESKMTSAIKVSIPE